MKNSQTKIIQWPIRQLAREIARSLNEHPERWEKGEYRATNKQDNVALWIANGRAFLEVLIDQNLHNTAHFNLIEKIYVWKALNRAMRSNAIRSLLNEN